MSFLMRSASISSATFSSQDKLQRLAGCVSGRSDTRTYRRPVEAPMFARSFRCSFAGNRRPSPAHRICSRRTDPGLPVAEPGGRSQVSPVRTRSRPVPCSHGCSATDRHSGVATSPTGTPSWIGGIFFRGSLRTACRGLHASRFPIPDDLLDANRGQLYPTRELSGHHRACGSNNQPPGATSVRYHRASTVRRRQNQALFLVLRVHGAAKQCWRGAGYGFCRHRTAIFHGLEAATQ